MDSRPPLLAFSAYVCGTSRASEPPVAQDAGAMLQAITGFRRFGSRLYSDVKPLAVWTHRTISGPATRVPLDNLRAVPRPTSGLPFDKLRASSGESPLNPLAVHTTRPYMHNAAADVLLRTFYEHPASRTMPCHKCMARRDKPARIVFIIFPPHPEFA